MKKYIKEIKLEIILQIISNTINSLALGGLAYIPKVIFDANSENITNKEILKFIIAFCGLSLIAIITSYYIMFFIWKLSIKFENSIKRDYFNSIINYDNISFYKKDVSEYISIQSNDITQLEQDYLTPLISLINQIIRIIIFGVIMFFGIDYRIALVITISSLITAILPKYTGKPTSSRRLTYVNNSEKYTSVIYDFFNGFREINTRNSKQIINRHLKELNKLSNVRYNYGKAKTMSMALNNSARTIVQVLGFVVTIVLLLTGEISIGTAAATFGLITSLLEPLEEALYCFNTIETVKDVKNKVFNLLNNTESNKEIKTIKKNFKNSLELKNLSSHNGEFAISNISLNLKKDKHYALIGHNGSGKSTLLNTIMGYIYKDSGSVLIDDLELSSLDLSFLITYLTQKSHIFSSNYVDNTTMFESYFNKSDELLKSIGFSLEFIEKLKFQINSSNLSGGEKQIVSYLRARNSNTPILIMDEPFSAVDKTSKELLMKDLASLKDKTIIMITHDIDESLDYFDEVIKMDAGKIAKLQY